MLLLFIRLTLFPIIQSCLIFGIVSKVNYMIYNLYDSRNFFNIEILIYFPSLSYTDIKINQNLSVDLRLTDLITICFSTYSDPNRLFYFECLFDLQCSKQFKWQSILI